MIYLYGLLGADAQFDADHFDGQTGVTGPVSVEKLEEGHLIYGPGPDENILPKRRFLLAHAKVLEHCNDIGTVLPMRFGMSAPTLENVDAMLTAQNDLLEKSFKKLNGATEIGVRVKFDRQTALEAVLADDLSLKAKRDRLSNHPRPPHFETADLGRALAESLGRSRDISQKAFLKQLKPLCRDYVLRAPEEDTHVISVDLLIDRIAQDDIVDAIAQIAHDCRFAPGAEPEIRIIGPVPAYNFVRLVLNADAAEAA
jgi:hypothetical protein